MIRTAAVVIALVAGVAAASPRDQAACPPRTLGPAALAHSRFHRHGRKTCRVTRRTPEVMQEEAARVPRGEIFSSWSNAARQ